MGSKAFMQNPSCKTLLGITLFEAHMPHALDNCNTPGSQTVKQHRFVERVRCLLLHPQRACVRLACGEATRASCTRGMGMRHVCTLNAPPEPVSRASLGLVLWPGSQAAQPHAGRQEGRAAFGARKPAPFPLSLHRGRHAGLGRCSGGPQGLLAARVRRQGLWIGRTCR